MSPREHAWQIIEEACGGDKSGDRATAILVLGLIPNDSRSSKLAQKALADPAAGSEGGWRSRAGQHAVASQYSEA